MITVPKLCEFKPHYHQHRSVLLLTNRVKTQIALPASYIVTVICKCYSRTQFFRMYKIKRHFVQRWYTIHSDLNKPNYQYSLTQVHLTCNCF